MQHRTLLALTLFGAFILTSSSASADPQHEASDYVNQIHHHRLLHRLRTSYDRWDNLALRFPEARELVQDFHIYGAQYDLNFGTKAENDKLIFPQTFGLALGFPRVRFYFLLHHTDIGNRSGFGYGRVSAGANLNLDYVTFQGEASVGTGKPNYYGKLFSPYLKTFFGLNASYYRREPSIPGGPSTPQETGTPRVDILEGATSALNVVNVGLRYYRLLKALSPNLAGSYSDFLDYEDWRTLSFDLELILASAQTSFEELEDFSVRLNYYHMLGEPLVEHEEGEIVVRPALLFGFSYKVGSLLRDELEKAGLPGLEELEGPGGEAGIVLRVLGFTRHGFPEASYVKAVVFYNQAAYLDTYPQQKLGFKFRVDY